LSEEISAADSLIRENAELRRRLDSAMHAGDMERARTLALIGAVTDMLNVLAVLSCPTAALWRMGGSPLENAYQGLKKCAAAVRPQADALRSELEAARAVVTAARVACEASLFDLRGPLVTEIARYDWAVQKAKSE